MKEFDGQILALIYKVEHHSTHEWKSLENRARNFCKLRAEIDEYRELISLKNTSESVINRWNKVLNEFLA